MLASPRLVAWLKLDWVENAPAGVKVDPAGVVCYTFYNRLLLNRLLYEDTYPNPWIGLGNILV